MAVAATLPMGPLTSPGPRYTNRYPRPMDRQRGMGGGGQPAGQPYRGGFPLRGPLDLMEFDGKRLRKSIMRKTVDYNSSIIRVLENRTWQRDFYDRRWLQPDSCYVPHLVTPANMLDMPLNAVTTKFVRTATNKMRCPIFCMAWTPEGRRLVTGASSGEFTLWNGLTFNFETILQAHDSPVRSMMWSHNGLWMVTGDHSGYIKYWQMNMNNVKMFQAHKEALRGISFSPTDQKFATCSDDGTVRVWDFARCHEERILRGHGADVKCVDWHPQRGLVISGSKDSQQPIKLWDPKTGQSISTLHAHKSTVMDLKWNENGNWLITASRDHLLKLFDLRKLNQEVQVFRGHKKEASCVSWHPVHEGLFASGGSDGSLMFWHVGTEKELGCLEQAHDSIIWALAWHPLGHILCSGSNDHSSRFWTRNRPGDTMRDKFNLNTLPIGVLSIDDTSMEDGNDELLAVIPGMGPEDKLPLDINMGGDGLHNQHGHGGDLGIPGLETGEDGRPIKKMPYAKPIPKSFQQSWNEVRKMPLLPEPHSYSKDGSGPPRSSGRMRRPPQESQGGMPPRKGLLGDAPQGYPSGQPTSLSKKRLMNSGEDQEEDVDQRVNHFSSQPQSSNHHMGGGDTDLRSLPTQHTGDRDMRTSYSAVGDQDMRSGPMTRDQDMRGGSMIRDQDMRGGSQNQDEDFRVLSSSHRQWNDGLNHVDSDQQEDYDTRPQPGPMRRGRGRWEGGAGYYHDGPPRGRGMGSRGRGEGRPPFRRGRGGPRMRSRSPRRGW